VFENQSTTTYVGYAYQSTRQLAGQTSVLFHMAVVGTTQTINARLQFISKADILKNKGKHKVSNGVALNLLSKENNPRRQMDCPVNKRCAWD
jgi:hypothetical protein